MLPKNITKLTLDQLEAKAGDGTLKGIFYVDHEDYHKGPGVSSTQVKKAMNSYAHFMMPLKDSDALQRGRAIHDGFLEPELFKETWEFVDKLPGFGTKKRDALQDNYPDKTLYDQDDKNVIDALLGSKRACSIRRQSKVELAAYATDPDTGILIKAKADMIDDHMISDVKSTKEDLGELYSFERAIGNYNYHVSAAFYLHVFNLVLPERIDDFCLIPVAKSEPFGIRFVLLSPEWISIGEKKFKKGLENIKAGSTETIYPDDFDLSFPPSYLAGS